MLLAERGVSNQAYNLCSGVTRSMRELFALACPDAEPVPDPSRARSGQVERMEGKCERMEALGWRRRYDIEKTLGDSADLLDMAEAEGDDAAVAEVERDILFLDRLRKNLQMEEALALGDTKAIGSVGGKVATILRGIDAGIF